jgi:hypothetical protein
MGVKAGILLTLQPMDLPYKDSLGSCSNRCTITFLTFSSLIRGSSALAFEDPDDAINTQRYCGVL